jgi:hypothetical protein
MPPLIRQRVSAPRTAAVTVVVCSALFGLAILILWGRSYRAADTLTLNGPGGNSIQLLSQDGRLMFGVFSDDQNGRTIWGWRGRFRSRIADLQLDKTSFVSDIFGWGVGVPHLLLLAVSVLPALWWTLVFRNRTEQTQRRERGLCWVCGYDLRATRDRCPECGQPVDATLTDLAPGDLAM